MRTLFKTIIAGSMLLSASANAVTWNTDHGVINELTPDHIAFLNEHRSDQQSGVLGPFFWMRLSDGSYFSKMISTLRDEAINKDNAKEIIVNQIIEKEVEIIVEKVITETVTITEQVIVESGPVIEALENRRDQLIADLATANNDIAAKVATITQLNTTINNLRTQIDGLFTMDQVLAAVASANSALNQRIDQLELSLSRSNQTLASVRSTLARVNQFNLANIRSLQELYGALSTATDGIPVTSTVGAREAIRFLTARSTDLLTENARLIAAINAPIVTYSIAGDTDGSTPTVTQVQDYTIDNYGEIRYQDDGQTWSEYDTTNPLNVNKSSSNSNYAYIERNGVTSSIPSIPPITATYFFHIDSYNIVLGYINRMVDLAYSEGYNNGYEDGYADGFRDGVESVRVQ